MKAMDVFLRAHTELVRQHKSKGKFNEKSKTVARWPKFALVIDCETTIDERQALTFGCYRFCRAENDGTYTTLEEGFFYPDELQEIAKDSVSTIQQYVRAHKAETPEGYSS